MLSTNSYKHCMKNKLRATNCSNNVINIILYLSNFTSSGTGIKSFGIEAIRKNPYHQSGCLINIHNGNVIANIQFINKLDQNSYLNRRVAVYSCRMCELCADHYVVVAGERTFRHGFIGKTEVKASRWRIPHLARPTKKYAPDNFLFFSPRILGHLSSYVSTDACYRDRNDARARPRVRIGRASRRFWKIKFIAFVASQPLHIMACPLENVKSITSLLVDFDVIFMMPRQLNVSANTMMGTRFRTKSTTFCNDTLCERS